MPRPSLAIAALLLAAHLPAQTPPRGLTVEQMLELQEARSVAFGDGFLVWTVRAPRPIADGPGGAYLHVWATDDLEAARQGKTTPRLLVGGKDAVDHVSARPRSREVTFTRKVDGKAQLFAISVDGGEPRRVADTLAIESYAWRPDGESFAFTALDPESTERVASRARGFAPIVFEEDWRHASLWLWEKGKARKVTEGCTVRDLVWSPDGGQLALTVSPRNLVDDGYVFTRLHVLDVASGTLRKLVDNPGKLGSFAWSPDGAHLAYIAAVDRNDPHAGMLFVADARTGESRCLTTGQKLMVHEVTWPGRIVCHVSRGARSELRAWTPAGEPDDSWHRDLAGRAVAGLAADRDGGLAMIASHATHPDEVFLERPGRDGAHRFVRVTDGNPWLPGVALGRQEVRVFAARDGTPIEGILIHPVGEGTGPHPLVIVVHGGPESHWLDGWLTSYGNWGQLLAARGYLAWFPNYRASTGYGVEFAKSDHGDPMGRQFDDILDGIRVLTAEGLADPTRVGIGGGSYGGYTAAWAATRATEHFAAAVSFVPFTDARTKWLTSDIPWEFYLVHYRETWPWDQAGLLADRSPLTWATRCRTPLLLAGGTADSRVHPSQPLMLYRAVKLGTETPVRYVQYPGEGHGNRSNVYRYDYALRALRWFDHYLKGDGDRRSKAPPPPELAYAGR